jgi:hypothetical protein
MKEDIDAASGAVIKELGITANHLIETVKSLLG